jgi:hypothetical protein
MPAPLVRYLRRPRRRNKLRIVLDMIEHKCLENIVVGFFQAVADVCLDYRAIPPANMQLLQPPGSSLN